MELSNATLVERPAVRAGGAVLGDLRRWSLMATLIVGAMVPWYTLRLFPVLAIGSAKINLLDVLVACSVLLAAPAIVERLRRGERELLWVCAFVVYMIVPFVIGLRDPDGVFYAVRESRALAFYALALVFAAGGYGPREFRDFAAAYAAGTVAAAVAVFAHVMWRAPLPGYPAMIASTPSDQAGVIARYLDWTVPVVAFTLSLGGVLTASSWRARLAWGGSLLCIVWYLVAMHERTAQGTALGVAIVLLALPQMGGLTVRRIALLALMLGVLVALGMGAIPGPRWIREPARNMLTYWSHIPNDSSIESRLKELRAAFPRFAQRPILGGGLGGIVNDVSPDFAGAGGPWRYVASGYGFLLVKTGFVGLFLYVAMVVVALRRGWPLLRVGRPGKEWPRAVFGVVGLGALLVLNLSHPAVDIPEGAIAFSLFFGMLVSGAQSGSS